MKILYAVLFTLFLFVPWIPVIAQVADFQVNENSVFSFASQYDPSISADGSGNFIIAWADGRNGNDDDIYAQQFASDGTALDSNFKVNDDQGSALQSCPSVSADGSGNFIITWEDERNSDEDDIYAQRYSSDGTALGSNFQVNDDIGSAYQWSPSISKNGGGNFIITWQDQRNGNDDIYAQRFSSDGTALGSNFQVNDDQGTAGQGDPSISADDIGNYFIAWWDRRHGNWDIYAQRYASDGTALGSNFKVIDDIGSTNQGYPSISVDNNGNFIITWQDQRNGDDDIYAQRFSSDGTALGSNFQVNDDQGTAGQFYPSISADDSSNFVITWRDHRNGEDDIYAQRHSSDGTAQDNNFKVNDDQGSEWNGDPSISSNDSGNFIITWQGERNGGSDIYAQRYSSDGTALGSNFQVDDDIGSENQWSPSISVNDSGDFIITWADERNGFDNYDIYAQCYSSDGTSQDSNFKVNDDQGIASQYHPSISVDSIGNFIISWWDGRNGPFDIYAQRFASGGTVLGSNFRVNDYPGSGYQGIPSISTDGSGNFIITWIDERNGNQDIYAQRYSSDGTALGSNFQVNDDQGSASQFLPSISVNGSGNFIITWGDGRNGFDNFDIYTQRYSSDGTALGSNFKVNDDPGNTSQRAPAILTDDSGNFIITWHDERNSDEGDIYAQRYSSDGTALGSNFQVNDDQGTAGQRYPSISKNDSGNFIITWHDYRNGNWDIYAQRYLNDGNALKSNFKITNIGEGAQIWPDVKLWNNLIYNTWQDNRTGGTGFDIWANVLDWDNPDWIGDDELHQIPLEFVLHQNYPNPFNSSTKIKYELPRAEKVKIEVFNLLGQKIETLINKPLSAGIHEVEFNRQNLSSGIYLYKIDTREFKDVRKMILLK
jgi:hypothetical protein